ncbi:hypothetical protein PRZ48_008083 [Zasmidium cellare]|uniref:Uncharacterized protein n=1 Tax=Zasmidium cellare TaxID=395010 RepID=A0ABR0EEK9_ZASCE|nr:hypothetical protein PRZ48_008083 [Zasmidium cellare]
MSALLRSLRLKPLSTNTLRRYSTQQQQQQQPPVYQPPSPTTSAATVIPPPPPPSESENKGQPNAHREFYRSGAGRAVAWNFLLAMATFQVLYLGWLKLESMEVKKNKSEEIEKVEAEAKGLVGRK